ncbi:glycosyltransferase family 9 protein [Helicobacter mesocricetorum]|uniref:glycosyltransferase family 9 protein n=1 Tax=Helicobacter mesocricetorum TaxID=87012 RepID=UPI000CF0A165|nr:glycosyltransferase family 9 protein [Helicobacter mesocricetorum]
MRWAFARLFSYELLMYLLKKSLNILVLGNIIRQRIGDEMVCIPMYYAIKCLYPNAKISVLTQSRILLELLKCEKQRELYVNEVLLVEDKQKWQKLSFDILLIVEHNNLEVLKIAQEIQAKLKIVTLSQSLLFSKQVFFYFSRYLRGMKVFINPYWSQTHSEIQRNLNLVRQINTRIFDRGFSAIDFSLAKLPILETTFWRNRSLLASLSGGGEQYSLVIGIFPFAKNMNKKANLTIDEWKFLAQSLSKEFPEVLLVFVNYPSTQYYFMPFVEKNLKVFYNQQGLEDLVAFIHSLDGILGVDSGHIHIADNARIPILEVIAKKVSKQWSGGFYGGYFQSLQLSANWREYEQENLKIFFKKAREFIIYLQNNK